jgi:hypothetical protein
VSEGYYWDIHIEATRNYLAHGLIHHNCGKTFIGAHWAIMNIKRWPHLSGFIGANTYDQLAQVALAELMYWLEHYDLPFVQDRKPPKEWGDKGRRQRKRYHNILSVLVDGWIVTIHTRVMSGANKLRGMEFSWAWIDELRDTKEEAYDEVLKRQRESDIMRTFVTTTTNGDSWDKKRFVDRADGNLYGSMHVPISLAVAAGVRTKAYEDRLRASMSPMMAAQELDALHVNALQGRAYYSATAKNARRIAPWGAAHPDPMYPLVIGCDFNFSPAPCVWIVGQIGPVIQRGDTILDFSRHIHWFGEIALTEQGTPDMTYTLLSRYPGFYYRIYGDASGNRGTTSNAGETDYNQISQVLSDNGAQFEIDVDQANPLVKNRVENMNSKFCNALGQIRQTYNPDTCPMLHSDINNVGWKLTIRQGQGKLDDGGDHNRTHATDAAGYAVWKLLPPGRRLSIVPTVPSQSRRSMFQSLEEGR